MEQWLAAAGEVLGQIARRAVTRQPIPDLRITIVLGLAALVLVSLRSTWRPVRMLCTVVHEAGHAVAAVVTGRRLSGIRLHADTSGLTVSRGRPSGPGMVLTLFAGYPAPAVVGLLAAFGLDHGYAAGVLWLSAVACALMLLLIRNLFGLLVILLVGGGIALASWFVPPVGMSYVAYLLVWLILLSAPRPLVELGRDRGRRGSDVDQLARLTGLPARGWLVVFWLVTLACLVLGGWLLVSP